MENKLITDPHEVRLSFETYKKGITDRETVAKEIYPEKDIADDGRRAYQEKVLTDLSDCFIESIGDSIEKFRRIKRVSRSGTLGFLIPKKVITLGRIELEDLEDD